jgi:hypothetical protein
MPFPFDGLPAEELRLKVLELDSVGFQADSISARSVISISSPARGWFSADGPL